MTDVQQARIEAAARAMWERTPREGDPTWADLDYGIKEIWRKDARAAIAAADAVVTVDQIERAIMGRTATAGARNVMALLAGGEPIPVSQHCTLAECPYSLSHTSEFCGSVQLRRCECGFCYENEEQS